MQLKQLYDIDTNVCIRKTATTFGDLPDWYMKVTPNIRSEADKKNTVAVPICYNNYILPLTCWYCHICI